MGVAVIAQSVFNKITFIILVALSIFLLSMVTHTYKFRAEQSLKGVQFRSLFILVYVFICSFIIFLTRNIIRTYLRPLIKTRLVNIKKYYTENSILRLEKYSIDLFHYFITTTWAFYLAYHMENIPRWVGGSCTNCK